MDGGHRPRNQLLAHSSQSRRRRRACCSAGWSQNGLQDCEDRRESEPCRRLRLEGQGRYTGSGRHDACTPEAAVSSSAPGPAPMPHQALLLMLGLRRSERRLADTVWSSMPFGPEARLRGPVPLAAGALRPVARNSEIGACDWYSRHEPCRQAARECRGGARRRPPRHHAGLSQLLLWSINP